MTSGIRTQQLTCVLAIATVLVLTVGAASPVGMLGAGRKTQQIGWTAILPSLVDAYQRGDFASVDSLLAKAGDFPELIRHAKDYKYPWSSDDGVRRQALMSMELAALALEKDRRLSAIASYDLLASVAHRFDNAHMSGEFERRWSVADVALLESTIEPDRVISYIREARKSFPDEPRFVMAEAILLDQRTSQLNASPDFRPAAAEEAINAYLKATRLAPVAAEAHVRLGFLYSRMHKLPDALIQLNAFEDRPHDAVLAYWAGLFRAQVLDRLDRTADAERAYRETMTLAPGAQSSRLGLMALLERHGDPLEAQRLAEEIETSYVADPYSWYWEADHRAFAALDRQLRDSLR